MLYTDNETCKMRLSNTHMAGCKRYQLSLFNLRDYDYIGYLLDAYSEKSAETIEEIIENLGNLVGNIIIVQPELIFDNEETKRIREEKIGFSDNATGGYTRYKLGDLIDAYVKKLVVESIPVFEDFALGVPVDGKR